MLDILSKRVAEQDCSPAQLTLAWATVQPGVGLLLIGASKFSQLRDNLASLEVSLAPERLERLDGAGAPETPNFFNEGLKCIIFSGATVQDWHSLPEHWEMLRLLAAFAALSPIKKWQNCSPLSWVSFVDPPGRLAATHLCTPSPAIASACCQMPSAQRRQENCAARANPRSRNLWRKGASPISCSTFAAMSAGSCGSK